MVVHSALPVHWKGSFMPRGVLLVIRLWSAAGGAAQPELLRHGAKQASFCIIALHVQQVSGGLKHHALFSIFILVHGVSLESHVQVRV